jgi:putative transport protein
VEAVIEILARNHLLLFFLILAIGCPLGRLKVAGVSLGMAATLFAGIAAGALDPRLKLDETYTMLGLAIFVYTIGLSSAQGFFAAMRSRGITNNLLTALCLVVGAFFTVLVARFLHLGPRLGAGLYTGAFTNAPALAGLVEAVKVQGGGLRELGEPAVACSIAYPMGVLGPILAMAIVKRLVRVDFKEEALRMTHVLQGKARLEARVVRVTRAEAEGLNKADVVRQRGCGVVFGRVKRDGELLLYQPELRLRLGDLVTVVGDVAHLDSVVALLGEECPEPIEPEGLAQFRDKRLFVSSMDVVGRPLKELRLPSEYGAIVTRLRRGDAWLVPSGETILELGDRVRVTTRVENVDQIVEIFGDSYRDLSEVDFLPFSLGLAGGLVLGIIPFPLPGGLHFRLGFAGGPLVVALVLGKYHRIGRFVWNFPYSANLTLRQLGLLMFAAGIGTASGPGFIATFRSGGGVPLFLGGAAITLATGVFLLLVGYRFFRLPMSLLLGILAGTQTMPVILGSASEETGNDIPHIGYSTVYPLAMILKIVLAQVLLAVIR